MNTKLIEQLKEVYADVLTTPHRSDIIVGNGKYYGMVNSQGELFIPCEFIEVHHKRDGGYTCIDENYMQVYYNGKGQECIRRRYKKGDALFTEFIPRDIPTEHTESTRVTFANTLTEMQQIHDAKNADYGDSFTATMDEFGGVALAIRLSDKLSRFKALLNHPQRVNDESIADTLLDLANYAVMGRVWIMNKK